MPQPTALILDDDGIFARAAGQLAFAAGFRVQLATTLAEGRAFLARSRADLLLLDLQLPDGSGMDLLDDIDLAAHGQIVIVTGKPSLGTAQRAVSAPVVEYLVKPLDPVRLQALMERVAARYRPPGPSPADLAEISEIVGNSRRIRSVLDTLLRVGPTDASLLLWGEHGTGKALAARAVHACSGRTGRLVSVNCSALPAAELASTLFCEPAGDDSTVVDNAFSRANGGTLLLEEIDGMPLPLQLRLVQALEQFAGARPGGDASHPAAVRTIASCIRDPAEAIRDRTLREDLYYALGNVSIQLPPLRERGEDVVVLAAHFIETLNGLYGRQKHLADGGEAGLLRHSWPGNVRELRSAVQRAFLLQDDDALHVKPVQPSASVWKESDTTILFSVGTTLAEIERRALLKTLAHFNNDKTATARALGVSVRTVHNQLARLGTRRTDGKVEPA